MVRHLDLVKGLKACHSAKLCIFAGNLDMAVATLSSAIRRHLSKFRDVAKSGSKAVEVLRRQAFPRK